MIGALATQIAVREGRVRGINGGELLYRHNFKDGMGDWLPFPRAAGGRIVDGELIIEESDAFNGFWLDGNYSECEVEVDMRRIKGEQSFIVGVGLRGVEDRGTMDCSAFSLSCQYGKNNNGYDVSFDKRVDFIRTVSELMGKDKFVGYAPEQNTLKIVYSRKKMSAYFCKDGRWNFLFEKNVWRVNERVFQSATVDGEKICLKVVNASETEQELHVELKNFGKKTSAKIITLSDDDENVINEIGTEQGVKHNIVPQETNLKIGGDSFDYTLDKNSVTVFVLD